MIGNLLEMINIKKLKISSSHWTHRVP